MTERQLVRELTKQLKELQKLFWYVPGDTYGGHKKPCDVLATYDGVPFKIEFKKEKETLEDHQKDALKKAYYAGDITYLAVFKQGIKHCRDIIFIPVKRGNLIKEHSFRLYWYRGSYIHLNYLFDTLIWYFTL